MAPKLKVIFGTAGAGAGVSKESLIEFMDILEKHGCKDLDTASRYSGSEKALGAAGAPARFTIHTKASGFFPGSLKREKVLEDAERSFSDLGTKKVCGYFVLSLVIVQIH